MTKSASQLPRSKRSLNLPWPKPRSPLFSQKSDVGRAGEARACAYLLARGWQILHRNLRLSRSEVDIIATPPGERVIVFVEIKTLSRSQYFHPSTNWGSRKWHALRRAVALYCQKYQPHADIRVDLITVTPQTISHFENVSWMVK